MPTAPPKGMTWLDLVHQVADEWAITVTDEEADNILWNYTGFPAFWDGDPEECCTQQLMEYFAGISPAISMNLVLERDWEDVLEPRQRTPWRLDRPDVGPWRWMRATNLGPILGPEVRRR